MPEKSADQFVRLFDGLNVRVDLAAPETAPQLVPPTMLHNAWLFRPFEMFVEMYGLPNYHDLDPPPFVAITRGKRQMLPVPTEAAIREIAIISGEEKPLPFVVLFSSMAKKLLCDFLKRGKTSCARKIMLRCR